MCDSHRYLAGGELLWWGSTVTTNGMAWQWVTLKSLKFSALCCSSLPVFLWRQRLQKDHKIGNKSNWEVHFPFAPLQFYDHQSWDQQIFCLSLSREHSDNDRMMVTEMLLEISASPRTFPLGACQNTIFCRFCPWGIEWVQCSRSDALLFLVVCCWRCVGGWIAASKSFFFGDLLCNFLLLATLI